MSSQGKISELVDIQTLNIEILELNSEYVKINLSTSGGYTSERLLGRHDTLNIKLTDNLLLAGLSLRRNNPELWPEYQLSDSQEKQESAKTQQQD